MQLSEPEINPDDDYDDDETEDFPYEEEDDDDDISKYRGIGWDDL